MLNPEDRIYGTTSGTARVHPFTTLAYQINLETPENLNPTFFQTLDLRLGPQIVEQNGTIYDAIDDVMWPEISEGVEVYMDEISDVFCITLIRDTTEARGSGIPIPTELYLDRYTKEFKHLIAETKEQREQYKKEIHELEAREAMLRQCNRTAGPVGIGSTVDTTKLLEAVIEHFEKEPLIPRDEADAEMTDVDTPATHPNSKMGSMLRGVLENLQKQLQGSSAGFQILTSVS